jgi:hypothetical protein
LFSSCFIRDFLASGRDIRNRMNTKMIINAAVTTSILNSCNRATGLFVYGYEICESLRITGRTWSFGKLIVQFVTISECP